MFRNIFGHFGHMCLQNMVSVEIGHFGAALDPNLVLVDILISRTPSDNAWYLRILCEMIESRNVKLELFGLCVFTEADSKGA